ncbi:MAG: hypothetical protein QOC64_466, partial [Solirubrobacteraceae bacterium]|nr:hypothetical protein [Solirubrobacteraceae bacterium]
PAGAPDGRAGRRAVVPNRSRPLVPLPIIRNVSRISRLLPAATLAALVIAPVPAVATTRPVAQTTPASAVGETSATLTGRVESLAGATSYRFEYGTTGYTRVTPTEVLPGDGRAHTVSATVEGLAPGTLHRFRVVAWYAWKNSHDAAGAEQTFTTAARAEAGAAPTSAGAAAPGAPAARRDPAAPVPPASGSAGAGLGSGSAPAPLPAITPATQPVLGRSVLVAPLQGTVAVKVPGASGFVTLAAGASVPAGAVLDARNGTVQLTSALDGGRSQAGQFRGAVFQVRQSRAAHGMTDLVLRGGDFGACPRRRAGARAARVDRRRPPVRRLWGEDKGGRFRTHGRNSVAVVRGTKWVTTDTCAGTRTTVTEGAVAVRDLGRRRTVLVRAGHSYLAPARR